MGTLVGSGSLSRIVTVSVAFPSVAWTGEVSVTVNVSSASLATSPITGMTTVAEVSPAAKGRVPDLPV